MDGHTGLAALPLVLYVGLGVALLHARLIWRALDGPFRPVHDIIRSPPMLFTWWQWLVLGLVLILLEMAASGGFYVIFFGVAALAIGALHLLNLAGPVWVQLLLFSLLSVGSLILFRNPMIRWLKLDQGAADLDTLAGEIAVPLEDIAPGEVGRVELRGTVWQARNTTAVPIPRGRRCAVVRVDRLMLFIEPEGART